MTPDHSAAYLICSSWMIARAGIGTEEIGLGFCKLGLPFSAIFSRMSSIVNYQLTSRERERVGYGVRAWFMVIALVLLSTGFLAGALVGYSGQKAELQSRLSKPAAPENKAVEQTGPVPAGIAPAEVHSKFRFGDNLSPVLKSYGISDRQVSDWILAAGPFYNLAKIKAGQEYWLRYGLSGQISQFELAISPRQSLTLTGTESGWQAELKNRGGQGEENIAFNSKDWRLYYGEIGSSFYEAGVDAGMEPGLISNLTNLYFGVIDFSSQVRKGDRFWVMTELTPDGDERPLVTEMEINHNPYQAYYYKDDSGGGYYDETGHALKGFYLIRPVAIGRISSGYSYKRFHPVLRRRIPHLAIDYAAPSGTRVRAAASGAVSFAGWKGGYGNYIELKHNSSYRTSYGHLKGFAPGIKTGSKVKQGQTIGYVGATGLATGAHLDYRVIRSGKNINPSHIKTEKGKPVKNPAGYQQARLFLDREMAALKSAYLVLRPVDAGFSPLVGK